MSKLYKNKKTKETYVLIAKIDGNGTKGIFTMLRDKYNYTIPFEDMEEIK
jgi:hypothetical protein